MARGIDTARLRIDKIAVREILSNCTDPTALKAIFEKSRDIVFGRSTVAEFNAFCQAQPCILFQPDHPSQVHVEVMIAERPNRVIISVTRIVWTIVNVVKEQGPWLLGSEVLLHTCGHNGAASTGHGACLNPAHLFKATDDDKNRLATARKTLREVMPTLNEVRLALCEAA